jgi:crotonobetainyl-CoA:carnitine CoA-transferase CaiB-like acyl-CoA transferase
VVPLLKGIKVVDLTAVILGPYATQVLGDLGADVIKVEPPEGDGMRPIAPQPLPGLSPLFANNNRNKASIVLDLKSTEGQSDLNALIADADVLIHNMRQYALDRLGFSYEAISAKNPRLVYVACVGFGREGPYAGQPAYDDVIQAASGVAGLFAMRDGTPIYPPSIIADKIVGLHAVYATLAAVLYRERSGQSPGYVEVPMFEAMAAFNLNEHLHGASFGLDDLVGYQRALAKDRKPYRTRDGFVGALPYTAAHWQRMFAEVGRAGLADEPWFRDPTERSKNFDRLYAFMSDIMPSRTTAEWLATFQRLDIPHAPIRTMRDLLHDEHLNAVGLFTPNFDRPTPIKRSVRLPISFSNVAREPDRPAPLLGEDTDTIRTRLRRRPR